MAETEAKKDRKWRLLLYPDDLTHAACMKKLEESGYNYAAILHDKDVHDGIPDEDDENTAGEIGTLKKPHWHVVLKTVNPQYFTALAKELGIKPNYFKPCKNLDKALTYLVHGDEKHADKYQYDTSEVFGPLAPQVAKLMASGDEGTKVLEIVKKVDSIAGRASYREMLVWACKNGLYGEFRRLGNGVGYLIQEHNAELADVTSAKADRECFKEFVKNSDNIDFAYRCQVLEKHGMHAAPLE